MIYFRQIVLVIILSLPNSVMSNSWSFNDLSLKTDDGIIRLQLGSIKIPLAEDKLIDVSYRCKASQTIYPLHECTSGFVSFIYQGVDYELGASGWVNLQLGDWDVVVSDMSSRLKIHLNSLEMNKINVSIDQIQLATAANFINKFITLDENISTGLLSAEIEIDFTELLIVDASYRLTDLSWESKTEEYILASTSHQGNLKLIQTQSGLELISDNHLVTGEGLFKDIYVLFDKNPIKTNTKIELDNNLKPINAKLIAHSTDAIKAEIFFNDWYKDEIKINYDFKDLNSLYQGFLKSQFEILGISGLNVSGISKGKVTLKNGAISEANLTLDNLDMGIESKKLLFEKVQAKLNWMSEGPLQKSEVSWHKLLLAGMPINKSNLSFSSVAQQLVLKENIELPVFDGSILIHELSLNELFEEQINIDFDGEIKPISIALITEKMGWPIMHGTISGKIPAMKKVGHRIRFDGSLDLNVFSGKMQVNNLSTERLLGVAPVIAADISFQELNLQQITSTFDFGEVTGLIEGYVEKLRITNWKADRMNAKVYSVKSKSIKQTISQRAIDNISSIGGIQGALSRSFLRFFDYFKYKKLGIGCKLRNSICEMSGLKGSNNNYQLIEGKGIPSINIIGFKKFIDWEIFLDRLLNAGY